MVSNNKCGYYVCRAGSGRQHSVAAQDTTGLSRQQRLDFPMLLINSQKIQRKIYENDRSKIFHRVCFAVLRKTEDLNPANNWEGTLCSLLCWGRRELVTASRAAALLRGLDDKLSPPPGRDSTAGSDRSSSASLTVSIGLNIAPVRGCS